MKRVLNVGGATKKIPIPAHYDGWEHVLLDVDPVDEADVVCDARDLFDLPAAQFDAVYCSHNLEHYWRHDVATVVSGFAHVLRPEGFAEILVPDLNAVFKEVLERGMDFDDVLYTQSGYEITVNDVVYGWGRQIAATGSDSYAHKNAFTARSLLKLLATNGFSVAFLSKGFYELRALAFKREPTAEQESLLGLAPGPGRAFKA